MEEEENDDYGTCSMCDGSFHRTTLKTVEAQQVCPTCLNKVAGLTSEFYNKKVDAYKRGMTKLAPRIKRLRDESYKLEVAYAKMFNRKRAIEEQLTPVRKLPTYKPTDKVKRAAQSITPEQLLSVMSKEEKAKLLRELGG